MCKRIFKNQTKPSGDVPFYTIGTFGKNPSAFIDKRLFDEYVGKYLFPKKGDILVSASGTIGRLVVYDGEPAYFQDSNIIWLQHDEGLILNTFLKYVYSRINWIVESSTMPRLYNSNFLATRVDMPDTKEQQKIATFLAAVDKRVALLERKVQQLEAYKHGVMQQLFSQQLRFTRPDGSRFPVWQEKRLGEIGVTYSGLSGKSGPDFGVGSPYITYVQIFQNSYIQGSFGSVSIGPNEKQNQVQKDDIFFTTSSETPYEVGYTSVLLTAPKKDTYLNSFCFGYRLKDKNTLLPEFAQYLFRSIRVRRNIVRLAQGSTRYNISKKSVMSLTIRLPLLEEQQKIAEFLSALDEKVAFARQQLDKTKQFKKGLLQRMFV